LTVDQSIQAKSLIRTRAKAGTSRKGDTLLPLCNRRGGIRLINCLQAFGIEINKNTVDEETWEVWLEMQKPTSQK